MKESGGSIVVFTLYLLREILVAGFLIGLLVAVFWGLALKAQEAWETVSGWLA